MQSCLHQNIESNLHVSVTNQKGEIVIVENTGKIHYTIFVYSHSIYNQSDNTFANIFTRLCQTVQNDTSYICSLVMLCTSLCFLMYFHTFFVATLGLCDIGLF